jgi:hypothetical protein
MEAIGEVECQGNDDDQAKDDGCGGHGLMVGIATSARQGRMT